MDNGIPFSFLPVGEHFRREDGLLYVKCGVDKAFLWGGMGCSNATKIDRDTPVLPYRRPLTPADSVVE